MKRLALHLQLLGLRFRRAGIEHLFEEYGEVREEELTAVNARIDAITRELAS